MADELNNESAAAVSAEEKMNAAALDTAPMSEDEAEEKGDRGRFGAGLPRISDGAFLFLQHMISKMLPADEGGSRIGIVFNGSPLFTGDAGSGESEIRMDH